MPTKNPNETTPQNVPGEVPSEKHEQGHTLNAGRDRQGQQQQGNPGSRQTQQGGGQQNEGEGNRTAARKYNTETQQAAQNPGRTERQAQDAKRAIDSPEGEELERAEEVGKKPARH